MTRPVVTPATLTGIRSLDRMPADEAVVTAWQAPGHHRRHHHRARCYVAQTAPALVVAIVELTNDGTLTAQAAVVAAALALDRTERRHVTAAMPVLAHNLDRLIAQERARA